MVCVLPVAARGVIAEAQAARTPPVAPQQISRDAGFVEEDMVARVAERQRSCQRWRAAARRCSSAYTVFDGQPESINRAPDRAQSRGRRQRVPQFRERRIRARDDQEQQPRVLIRRQRPATTDRLCPQRNRPRLPPPLDQPVDPRPAHLVFRSDALRAQARVPRLQDALPQIQ